MNRIEMAGRLRSLVAALYRGAPVPAVEGGLFFREVCEERRRAGDMFWTERRVYDLARELGYWPWSIAQIAAAFGQASLDATAVESVG